MKFVQTDSSGFVTYLFEDPFNSESGLGKTEAELRAIGFLTERQIPEPEKNSKAPKLYYTEELGFYYLYEAYPLTIEERINLIQAAIDGLILGGAL